MYGTGENLYDLGISSFRVRLMFSWDTISILLVMAPASMVSYYLSGKQLKLDGHFLVEGHTEVMSVKYRFLLR